MLLPGCHRPSGWFSNLDSNDFYFKEHSDQNVFFINLGKLACTF